jgi:hypothetical protein
MPNKDAFPSTVREVDGEIVPSYSPGNGNEPSYPHILETPAHLEFDDVSPALTTAAETARPLPVPEALTGKNHPVIRAAIEASRAHGPLPNSAMGATPRFIHGRERVLGGRFK